MAYNSNFTTAISDLVENLTDAEKLNMSEMLFSKAFGVDSIQDTHRVVTGVRNGNYVPILRGGANYESFPFNDMTDCEKPTCDLGDTYSSFRWSLGLIECRVAICMRTFTDDFNLFWGQMKQITPDVDLNTAFLQYAQERFAENLRAAMWRVGYFGDTASASNLFNGIDGFFTQGEANPDQLIDIPQNAEATYAEQRMTGEEVYNLLTSMYNEAALTPWFDENILEFRIPRIMATSLVTWLNGLADASMYNCDCINPNAITGRRVFTVDGLRLFGLPVLVHKEWDGVINGTSELNGGGGANPRVNPNRAFLTYRDNLLIGTSETEALEYFDIFFDKKDNMVYLDGGSYIGAAIPLVDEYILATGVSGS